MHASRQRKVGLPLCFPEVARHLGVPREHASVGVLDGERYEALPRLPWRFGIS